MLYWPRILFASVLIFVMQKSVFGKIDGSSSAVISVESGLEVSDNFGLFVSFPFSKINFAVFSL